MRALILSIALLFINNTAFAIPLPKAGSEFDILLLRERPHFTPDYNFNGIVALNNCSGSLIRLTNSRPTDRALILTNGHCVEMMDPGEVIYKRGAMRTFRILDNRGESLGRVRSESILYATMTKTDMAIYKLEDAYQDIERNFPIQPLLLSDTAPQIADPIEVISGYWRRGYSCAVEAIVHSLKESSWLFTNSIRYTRGACQVIGGTSGSPVVHTGTRTVIAVNNTGNEDGQACTMNNPCEIDEHGRRYYERGLSYAQQTYWVYSCLNDDNDIDLEKPGCLLPK